MDRYITRERRIGAEYPEGNQAIPFSTTSVGNNITIPEHVYYSNYNNPMHSQDMYNYNAGAMIPPMQTYAPNMNRPDFQEYHLMQPAHIMPGVDHRYLAYTDNSTPYVTGQHSIQANTMPSNAFSDYQNRNLMGADRTDGKHYVHRTPNVQPPAPFIDIPKPIKKGPIENLKVVSKVQSTVSKVTPKKQVEADLLKSEVQNEVKSRADKLKELHKSGTRVFCGSIENVLKWHKMIQEIGVMVLYDIVGKCVSVRPGESCAKNLVVRDENGPAIQVVYYEIDFMLPKLQIPCTIRVLGRVLPASSRVHALSVRAASGDDVATLPRRAAVAAHHVAKLCSEYC